MSRSYFKGYPPECFRTLAGTRRTRNQILQASEELRDAGFLEEASRTLAKYRSVPDPWDDISVGRKPSPPRPVLAEYQPQTGTCSPTYAWVLRTQSGESATRLDVLRWLKQQGAHIISEPLPWVWTTSIGVVTTKHL